MLNLEINQLDLEMTQNESGEGDHTETGASLTATEQLLTNANTESDEGEEADFQIIDEDMDPLAEEQVNQEGGNNEEQLIGSQASPHNFEEEEDLEIIDEDDFFPKFQQNALSGLLQDTELHTRGPKNDMLIYLRNLRNHLEVQIKNILEKKRGIKFWVSMKVSYIHPSKEDQAPMSYYLHTGCLVLLNQFELQETLDVMQSRLLARNAHFIREQSGLVLKSISAARFKVCQYLPLAGKHKVKLPKYLADKRAIINVQNDDDRCFGYAILSALFPRKKNANEPYHYAHIFERFGLNNIQYPVWPADVPQIEDQLKINMNLFSFFDDKGHGRYPLYVSRKNHNRTIDLLYWNQHYGWIKRFSALMNDMLPGHNKMIWCRRCLGHFSRETALETHQLYCRRINFCDQIFTMPPEGSKLRFKHFRYIAHGLFIVNSSGS